MAREKTEDKALQPETNKEAAAAAAETPPAEPEQPAVVAAPVEGPLGHTPEAHEAADGTPVNGAGTPTTEPDIDGTVEVTLAAHLTRKGKNYMPGDTIRVRADEVDAMRTSGYAKRED